MDIRCLYLPVIAAILCGCGGGSGTVEVVVPPPVAPVENTPAPQSAISGTAAAGAALAQGAISITDRSGNNACASAAVTTDAQGAFQCVLTGGAAAPFALLAVDPKGLRKPMVSLATERPALGTTATVNITPLTTGMAAQLAPHKDPYAFTTDAALLAALAPSTFNALKANVAAQLSAVLAEAGVAAATFDPVSTAFVGGSNTGVDRVLDQVSVSFENGSPVLTNLLNPDAAPVALADVTGTPSQLPASAVTGTFSLADFDFLRTGFERCFAVAAADRAGNAACTGIFVDDAPPALTGGATFLNNGFSASVAFGSLLASADMDGATFNRPELVRYLPASDGRDMAVVNLKFNDKNGVGDNRIIVLKKFTGTSTAARPTDWWAWGNQHTMNFYVRTSMRQQEQMLPDSFLATFNAGSSRYQTGLEIYIARPCANATGVCPNSSGVRYVRVKGPGLPDAGLVYGDVNLPQSWMSILNATGSIPSGTQQFAAGSNNIFYLQRSVGITGTAAFTVRPNPAAGQATPSYNSWAHPSMYGEAPSPTWLFDLAKVPAWSQYVFEVFRDGATTTTETYTTHTVTPVVPAAYGAVQQWHSIPAAVKALASDGAAPAAALTLDWAINPLAERVDSVNVYSFDGTSAVNSASTPVPKGATSQTATAVGGQFGALTTSTPPFVSRTLQWRYKMLDGSYRDQTVTFN